ncbi:aminotransferase class III-fold pyridoxal phosphate-dependent enzyme [Taklimakanibacter lacteus]|uniref:aminotransferase class III-fold pyridoxal phosphate-dependent enzyme n=1 Tax=Taklimakanibacter lacteus TaxID=2268456 RepID=UPI000E66EF6A
MTDTTETTLTALAGRAPVFSTTDAARIARDLYGAEGPMRALDGERDQNFHVGGADGGIVLKIIDPTEDPDVVDLQIAALLHVASVDPSLPVPRILRTRTGEDRAVVRSPDGTPHIVHALSFLKGDLLENRPAGEDLLRETGRMVARLGLTMRGFFHKAADRPIAWDPRQAVGLRRHTSLIADRETRQLVELGLARFIARLPDLRRLRAQLIHHDCHPGNILIDPANESVSGLLDFGDMIHGPLVFDLAVTAAETHGEGLSALDSAAAVIAGYRDITALEDAEYAALYDTMLARHAVTLAIHAWRGRHAPESADKLARYCATNTPSLAELVKAGPEKSLAAFRRKPGAASTRSLIARRMSALGKELELTYAKPVHAIKGEGVFLWEPDGTRLLDCYNNVPSVGHAQPDVAAAIARQAAEICSNTRYLHETVVAYAERLIRTMPAGLDRCLFVNSGSEANDAAWRIAKAVTGRTGAIIIANAYHGITDATAALSPYSGPLALPSPPYVETIEPPDMYRGRFRDDPDAARLYAADVDRAIAALLARGHGVAAFYIDSAFCAHGILDAPQGWLPAVAERIRAAGGLIVADEVQSGFGRMGEAFWGVARQGVVPDFITSGKPMANGHPVGVVVTTEAILSGFARRVDFFSTFGGNPVSAAAALATLDVIERDRLQDNCLKTGTYFRGRIEALMQRHGAIGEVRGAGLMTGVDIVGDRITREAAPREARRIANRMRERGVLVGIDGPLGNVLKVRPPMPFKPEHADIAVAVMDEAMEAG